MQTWQERITINPEIRFGKPCIKGSRITGGYILGWIASDICYKEILEDFPELKRQEILAAFTSNREDNMKILITV